MSGFYASARFGVLVAVLASLIRVPNAPAAIEYAITDLGTLGGSSSYATSINASSQVVGYSTVTNNAYNAAFLYANGSMVAISGTTSEAFAINNKGVIVGQANEYIEYYPGDFTIVTHAVIFGSGGGGGSDLGSNPPSDPSLSSYATGINDSGMIVGYSASVGQLNFGSTGGFISQGGFLTNLQVVNPTAINDSGLVVGGAMLYNSNTKVSANIGSLGGSTSGTNANAINASGQVVGSSMTIQGITHAFSYSGGKMTDLGTLGGSYSEALSINAGGLVVGDSYTNTNADHAFLYAPGTIFDLNNLIDPNAGWTLQTATAINDSGEIVGQGINPKGQSDAFLLTPLKNVVIPEPSSVALVGLAMAALLARRSRSGGHSQLSRKSATTLA